ncbi:MAG: (Fe-S)-binding protein [Bacteroidales bacterium]|jgi:Fe-S oxidoreductase|nr:(Fe-S)-binding protein [Bacteroidales bacterium]MDY0315027.1 (Fe-S)-binding protein [Bacteroidales bacterium]NLB85466.1 (Fe-S)-binding protein [Bacteroidales bacterium]
MNYNNFIIPFCLGASLLLIIIIYKFAKWLSKLDKKQKYFVKRNFFSKKSIAAINEVFREALIHRNIYRKNPLLGYMHMSLAFGWFLLIVVGKIEASFYAGSFFEEPWLAIFFKFFAREQANFWVANFFSFTMDLLLLIVLSGLALAIIKRLKSKILGIKKATKHVIYDKIALTALWLIFPLRLLAESSTAALVQNGSFLTGGIGELFSLQFAQNVELPLYWAYSSVLFVFFVSLPFSRYMHIPSEVVLIFLRKWGAKAGEQYSGLSDFEINSCSRCGICIDACQLSFSANINNVQSVYFIRDTRYKKLNDNIANNCLMCGRCTEACPVGLELTLIRQQLRTKTEIAGKHYYDYCENKNNKNKTDIIYFAGCMTQLTPNIIIAMKNIFSAAKVKYWFMDEDKGICCGRPMRQQGFVQQSKDLISKNTKLISKSGAKLLICSCPICYKSFKEEYSLDIEIMHHSEYIKMLIDENKIKLNKSELNIVFHDPCELGRGLNIYKPPRQVLSKIGKIIDTEFSEKDSLCCGGSLANTVIELETQLEIRNKALEILTKSKPDILATACPLCKKSFTHAYKGKVMDIAEIVSKFLYLQNNSKKQEIKEKEIFSILK